MMSIGRFARQSGLSIGALRYYAEIDLLIPAQVDPDTGYRYYADEQVAWARLIAALRDLDVPLGLIRQLRDATPAEIRARLAHHRADLDAAIWRLQRTAHRLQHFIENEETIMATSTFTLDPDDERHLAATLFNHVWTLLERTDRGQREDDEMLHAAHASRHHWGAVGGPVQWARGEWQCSRVYAVLARTEPALHHGRRCLALAEQYDLGPFDIGYGHEAIARAYWTDGRRDDAQRHIELGYAAADKITDTEERDLLRSDLVDITSLPTKPRVSAPGER
ncbi:MAG TPA: helix-turn-helix domain-containing protein [Micromonosporaceae bacterium]